MRQQGFKYRLYPTDEQATLLSKHFGCSRFVYNHALERKNTEYTKGNKISHHQLVMELPDLKQELPWLSEVNAQALQMSIRNLDVAFTRFFKHVAEAPTFKKKFDRQSFQCPQACSIDMEKGLLFVPKFREGIKAVFHRKPLGKFKTFTVSRDKAGNHWVSILCEIETKDAKPKPVTEETSIGIDLGLKAFATLSDGRKFENPKFLRASEKRLAAVQRSFDKKKKKSKNREKARRRLAKLHWRIANRRSDFLHKLSRKLVDENQVDTFCMETLNVKGMLKNHCLAKSISDASWSEFVRQMEYKCAWKGKSLLRIGRFEPSSKTCHECGFYNKNLKLEDREWVCPHCHAKLDRDVNAAKNILTMALLALINHGEKLSSLHGTGSEDKQSLRSGQPPLAKNASSSRASWS